MANALRNQALNTFKNNKFTYISLGLMCGLLVVLILALNFVLPNSFIITLPFLILPLFFSFIVSGFFVGQGLQVNVSNSFTYYLAYFKFPFNGCFRAIISFFKSFLVFLISYFIASFIFLIIFQSMYGETFINCIEEIGLAYLENDLSVLETYLQDSESLFYRYYMLSSSYSFIVSVLFFFYRITMESLSIYFRLSIRKINPSFLKMTINQTFSKERRHIRKDYFILNWPMFLLFVLGTVIGALLSYYVFQSINYLPDLMIIFAFAMLIFFFPFYFVNMQTIYKKYEPCFKYGAKETVESLLRRMQANIDIQNQEKEGLEKMFVDDEDDQENKKDPD